MKIYIIAAAAVAISLAVYGTFRLGARYGEANVRAEQAKIVTRKLNDASIADDAHNRCLADPTCRLSNDGFRRD